MTATLPKVQAAVQLVGPGELKLNREKEVRDPGPHEILAEVQAVGLCFSDLKVLKQFDQHVRKSDVVSGIDLSFLPGFSSYAPGSKPTVPGHEIACRIIKVGEKVTHFKPGDRMLVQPDFRNVLTAGSNSAMGYNFEGGLQRYVLMDERLMVDAAGDKYLIPVEDHLGSSQAALVEPWACVEDSYVTKERQVPLKGGRMLVVAEAGYKIQGLEQATSTGKPKTITAIVAEEAQYESLKSLGVDLQKSDDIGELPKEGFDDIVYFGAKKETLEALNDKLASRAIMNIVQGGQKIGDLVSAGVGRIHYGMTRWVGTTGNNAADGYTFIPADGEIRDGDKVLVIGAGGPMGQMHIIRNICAGKKNIRVDGTDFDQPRLDALARKAGAMAKERGVESTFYNPKTDPVDTQYTYIAIMAPVGALVADAIKTAAPNAIVNIFAGIPAPVSHEIDLDAMIEKRIFLFGTSGSSLEDMKIVLGKVTDGSLNTNTSVDAISGMAGAIDGIGAVENRSIPGKIIVYPMLEDVGLIPLTELDKHFPSVAAKLDDGQWCREAEDELLKVAAKS